MKICRATTPTFEFVMPEVLTNYDDGNLTFSQNKQIILEKTLDDLTLLKGTTYYLTLTQEETQGFTEGIYDCQFRLSKNGQVFASQIYRGRIDDVLNDAILEVDDE